MKRAGLVICLAAAVVAAAGCSDDVTCPEQVSEDPLPLVLAEVVEVEGDGAGTTVVLYCVADPLPTALAGAVNDRALDTIGPATPLGLEASLADTRVVWVPGTPCTLDVQIDGSAFATADARVPGPATVTAPGAITLGDSLALSWTAADDADHYSIVVSLDTGAGDPIVKTGTSLTESFVLDAEDITEAGTLTGYVAAISGPFNDGGEDGNVSGDAWGFFTVSYRDAGGTFVVQVEAGS